jgi:hypothetical protein
MTSLQRCNLKTRESLFVYGCGMNIGQFWVVIAILCVSFFKHLLFNWQVAHSYGYIEWSSTY